MIQNKPKHAISRKKSIFFLGRIHGMLLLKADSLAASDTRPLLLFVSRQGSNVHFTAYITQVKCTTIVEQTNQDVVTCA